MEKLLQDKVAVITGSGFGLGKAIALRFGGEGCHIAVCDIDKAAASDTAAEIEAGGTKAAAFEVDVTDSEAVQIVIDKIIAY